MKIWLKSEDSILGPLTVEEIEAEILKGQLRSIELISYDKNNWLNFKSMPEYERLAKLMLLPMRPAITVGHTRLIPATALLAKLKKTEFKNGSQLALALLVLGLGLLAITLFEQKNGPQVLVRALSVDGAMRTPTIVLPLNELAPLDSRQQRHVGLPADLATLEEVESEKDSSDLDDLELYTENMNITPEE